MKRAKRLIAILSAAVLTLGVSAPVFAAPNISTNYAMVNYRDASNQIIGQYPQFNVGSGYESFNKDIASFIDDNFRKYGITGSGVTTKDVATITVTTEDPGATDKDKIYAKLEVNLVFKQSTNSRTGTTLTKTIYFNKDTKKEVTAADYTKATTPEAAKPAAAAKVTSLPLLRNAEEVGWEAKYYALANKAVVRKGTTSYTLYVDNKEVTKDVNGTITKVTLDAAPTLFMDIFTVPDTFFSKVMGLNITVGDDLIIKEKK